MLKAVEVMISACDKLFAREWSAAALLMTDDDIEEMAEPEATIEDVLNEEVRRANRKGSLIPYEREDLPGILHKKRPSRPPPKLPS
jgi:hypothetical protein